MTLLDITGAVSIAAIFAIDVMAITWFARIALAAKIAAWLGAGAWGAVTIAITAAGGFEPGVFGMVPTPVLPFLIANAAWLIGWYAWPSFRTALTSVPTTVLIGVHVLRLVGIFFLLLWSEGRLSAPFAPSAGWGDIITAVAAIFLGLAALKTVLSRKLLAIWNVFGALDLIIAVILALFSVPGAPWRIFWEAPGTVVLDELPWIGIVALIVPFYLMTHFVIWQRIRAAKAD